MLYPVVLALAWMQPHSLSHLYCTSTCSNACIHCPNLLCHSLHYNDLDLHYLQSQEIEKQWFKDQYYDSCWDYIYFSILWTGCSLHDLPYRWPSREWSHVLWSGKHHSLITCSNAGVPGNTEAQATAESLFLGRQEYQTRWKYTSDSLSIVFKL